MATAHAYLAGKIAANTTAKDRTALLPQSYQIQRIYGKAHHTLSFRCQVTVTDEDATSDALYTFLDTLTLAFLADQTAGGTYSQLDVSEWTATQVDQNYMIFESTITVSE